MSKDFEEVHQLAYEYGHNEDGSGYLLTNEQFENCLKLAVKLYKPTDKAWDEWYERNTQ